MISRKTAEFFGYGPKELKFRIKRLSKVDRRKYSESQIVIAGITRVIDEFEQEAGIFASPVQVGPRRPRPTT